MNFEELIEIRNARKTTCIRTPYGYFYKRLIDGRFYNYVEFHDELTDSLVFSKGVQEEYEATKKITDRHQLHFTPNEGDDGLFAIAVEVGHFLTIGQMLNDDPAIVAQNDFLEQTIRELFKFTILLNEQGIYHLCYSPNNVFIRKSDRMVYLLNHGSFYLKADQDVLYEDDTDATFVAPEVLKFGKADAHSEVYALGKFLQWIYQSSGLPTELKSIVNRATQTFPELRYGSVEEMYKAISRLSNLRRTVTMGAVALAVALVILGLFVYLLPSPDAVEFVKPVKEPVPDEMVDDELLLGIGADLDSAAIARIVAAEKHRQDSLGVDERDLRIYNSKAEAIFRKQFTRAADQILDKVYTGDKMNMSEKEFLVRSKAMTEELAKKQAEIAKSSSLSSERSQHIASEIIDQLTDKKMKALDKNYMGLKPVTQDKKTTPESSYSSSSEATLPTTTTTTPSTSNSSRSKTSNQDIYRQHRDKYGVDPYDPVAPENYQYRRK